MQSEERAMRRSGVIYPPVTMQSEERAMRRSGVIYSGG
jgi:hypothetical protein